MKKIIVGCCVFELFLALTPIARAQQEYNPKLLAQKFYQAWHLKNKKVALKIADKKAVAKLFSVKWRAMKFGGCNRREGETGFECIFTDTKNDLSLAMIIDGGASVGGYNVASVSFSSEE